MSYFEEQRVTAHEHNLWARQDERNFSPILRVINYTWLAAYELDKFEQDRREIYIYDLAVAENHRRKGIARNLINELRYLARQRKAYAIYVQADREDTPAIRLYESLGSKEDVHHFDISVDSETPN